MCGDTGKDALEGFCDVEGTEIIVFYPDNGVSKIQQLQMQTQKGENVAVCGVKGNFDDTQTAVKTIFTDKNIHAFQRKALQPYHANICHFGKFINHFLEFVVNGGNT